MSSTFFPACASPIPKLAQAVVLPTSLLVGDGDDLRVQDNHLVSWYEKRENVTGINILPWKRYVIVQ
jgi:hypothetical protein